MSKRNLMTELSDEQLNTLLAYTPEFSEENLENIKKLSLEKIEEKSNRRHFLMKKFAYIAAVAALLLITTTGIFAATGDLEQFLSRFNPNFGALAVAPIYPAYSVDEGIRIEAVGAQQIDNIVLVYVTMQDISGENRLTRYTSHDLEIYVDDQMLGGARSSRRLNFDSTTNTSYFEIVLVGEPGLPKADEINLVMTSVQDLEHSGPIQRLIEGDWSLTVNASDLGIKPIVWENVIAGNLQIEHMSLTPFGLQMSGNHTYGMENFPFFDIRVELENRLFRVRLPGGGAGIGDYTFTAFQFADSPIDLENVTAVVINGTRISVR